MTELFDGFDVRIDLAVRLTSCEMQETVNPVLYVVTKIILYDLSFLFIHELAC